MKRRLRPLSHRTPHTTRLQFDGDTINTTPTSHSGGDPLRRTQCFSTGSNIRRRGDTDYLVDETKPEEYNRRKSRVRTYFNKSSDVKVFRPWQRYSWGIRSSEMWRRVTGWLASNVSREQRGILDTWTVEDETTMPHRNAAHWSPTNSAPHL